MLTALTPQQSVSDPLFWHRVQFGFTITFHYLFPQLTMGLALLVLLFKLRSRHAEARFWIRVLGINFAIGVVTGIPMEFQFGTNWARFSHFAGSVIACSLQLFPTGDRQGKLLADRQPVALAAMEGVFRAEKFASLAIIGQPDVANQRLENPIVVPGVLSFLAYGSFGTTVRGLAD